MPLTVDEICAEAMALPIESKASLVEKLVASIETKVNPNIERLHLAEAKRRRDEIRQGKTEQVPGKDSLAKVRATIEK